MNTKQLKAKVLDLAIHGKLLSPETVAELKKSPDYETADVLLEKIRKEKEEKIAKGELKRDKKDSYIFVGDDKRHYEKFTDGTVKDIEDEIPFDVPEGWAWCKLRDILTVIRNGATIKQSKDSKGLPITRIETISQGIIDRNKFGYADIFDEELFKKYYLQNNDILMSHINSPIHLGKCAIYKQINDNEKIIHGMNLLLLRFSYFVSPEFIMFVFKSSYFKEYVQMNMKEAVNQASISTKQISDCLIPMPSIIEQKQIVTEIEKLYQHIDTIENDKVDLQIAIKKAKSKILDLAIHGKLVPQDANDEPASVLLERLRSEKEEKIAKGELKRDKNDSYIYKGSDNCYYQRFADGSEEQAEITYEIPPNWVWCSLGEISTKLKRGKSPTYTKKSSIMAFAQKCNQKEGPTTLEKALYIDESTLKKYPDEEKMQFNDIVINSTGTGTLGRVGVFNCKVPDDVVAVYPDSHVSSVRINSLLYAKYFYYFVKNKQSYLEEMGEGSTNQKELKIDTIANLIVPLPPLDEQKRIVEKIENAFAKLDSIAKQLE